MPRKFKLEGLETVEMSVVKRGANNKRVSMSKSLEEEMTFQEMLKKLLATKAEGEDALVASLKEGGATDEEIEIAKAHFRMQHSLKDKFSKEQFEAVARAAGYEVEKEEPAASENPPPAAPPSAVAKSASPEVQAYLKSLEDKAAVEKAAREELQKRVEKQEKDLQLKEFKTTVEKKYDKVPGKGTEEMAKQLQKAYDVSEEFGKELEEQWASIQKAMEESELMTTFGSTIKNAGAGAMEKLQSIAKENKASDETPEQAFAKACKDNPSLYQEYLNENPAQTGRRY